MSGWPTAVPNNVIWVALGNQAGQYQDVATQASQAYRRGDAPTARSLLHRTCQLLAARSFLVHKDTKANPSVTRQAPER